MARSSVTDEIASIIDGSNIGSQQEIRDALMTKGLDVTQSTISRTLKKLGIVRMFDENGHGVYRLPEETTPPDVGGSLAELITGIGSNESTIVVGTKPGCAGLVARHLDYYRPGDLLGTIAGDDAIFVAPASIKKISETVTAIEKCLNL